MGNTRERKLFFKRQTKLIQRVGVITIAATLALSIPTISKLVTKVSPSNNLQVSVITAEAEGIDEELIDPKTEAIENNDLEVEENTVESDTDLIAPEKVVEDVPEPTEPEADLETDVDLNELAGLVEMTKGYEAQDYTEDSYGVLSAIVQSAENLLVKDDLNQDHVDSVSIALKSAIDGLVKLEAEVEDEGKDQPEVSVSTSELEALIQEANGYNAADYTEESFANLQGTVQVTGNLIGKAEVNQDDINIALNQLQNAIRALNKLGVSTPPEPEGELETESDTEQETQPEVQPESEEVSNSQSEENPEVSEPSIQQDEQVGESDLVASTQEKNGTEMLDETLETIESASTDSKETAQLEGSKLPDTATSTYNMMLVGVISLMVGGLSLLLGRRKKMN